MKKNILKIIIIFFVILFPFIILGEEPLPVFERALEVEYPVIGGVKPETTALPFPSYVKYIYDLSLYIGGTIAVISILAAGLMYLTSAGSPERIRAAKKRFLSVFLGLTILFSAFLILRTIHLSFVELHLDELDPLDPVEITFPHRGDIRVDINYSPSADSLEKIEKLTDSIMGAFSQAKERSEELKEAASSCNCERLEPVCTYNP